MNILNRIIEWGMILTVAVIVAFIMRGCQEEARAEEIRWDNLVQAIIQVESDGDPNAVGKDGEIGLMQISQSVIDEYAEWVTTDWSKEHNMSGVCDWGKEEWIIPEYNIKLGTWYLHHLDEHYLKEENVQLFDDPKLFKSIAVNTYHIVPTYRFEHTKYIKCADDYRIAMILAAYNGGPTRLRKVHYDIRKMPKLTQRYIEKVLKLYKGRIK